jgi:hypothetical protein
MQYLTLLEIKSLDKYNREATFSNQAIPRQGMQFSMA